ncbi:MAG TPA: MoaD/ThiS family protein [Rhodanobacteraceae bacterium]|nr:MoaD/ThiS family protein [Rhodanobacteraceae bacterium]
MNFRLLYFASLADRAGCAEERIDSPATTPRELHAELNRRHAPGFGTRCLRVAVNGALVDWNHALAEGDEVVFLPPVSGG